MHITNQDLLEPEVSLSAPQDEGQRRLSAPVLQPDVSPMQHKETGYQLEVSLHHGDVKGRLSKKVGCKAREYMFGPTSQILLNDATPSLTTRGSASRRARTQPSSPESTAQWRAVSPRELFLPRGMAPFSKSAFTTGSLSAIQGKENQPHKHKDHEERGSELFMAARWSGRCLS